LENIKIFVDYREKASSVPSLLSELGVNIFYENLTVGDYILPNNHAVERKNVEDFLSSMLSGRVFNQAYRLIETYPTVIFIVEGDLQTALKSFSKPKSIWGALTSLSIKYGVHVFFTADKKQTAELIKTIARQALKTKPVEPILRERRKIRTLDELQLYVVSSLPGVGLKLADRLLKKFKNVRNVFQASKRDLMLVEGFSKSKIEKICELLDSSYNPSKHTLPHQKILDEV